MIETKSKSFLANYSSNVTTIDVEKETGGTRSFKKQLTIPIIAYLTLQNFFITTLIAGFATGFYYNYSVAANYQSALHGLELIRNFTKLQQGFAAEEVNDHIHIFLGQPVLILHTSGDLQVTGLLNLDNFGAMYPWFFHHIHEYNMVTSIAFVEYPSGDTFAISSYNDGDMTMYNLELTNSKADRLCPGSISVGGFCPVTNGSNTIYPITGTMEDMANMDMVDSSMATTEIVPPMFGSPNPTELGAFTMLEAGRHEVSWFPKIKVTNPTTGMLGLYFVFPMWTDNDTFIGSFVGEMDFLITQELLHHLKEESTENTVIYIFQRDEVMIGTSTDDPIVQFDPELGTASTMKVTDMTNPFIKFSQAHFRSQFGGSYLDVPVETVEDANLVDPSSGIAYLLRFTALAPGSKLEWMVIVGAPEDDYIGKTVALQNSIYNELQANNRNVVILIFTIQFVLILAVVAFLWYRVVQPLRTLVVGMNMAKEFDFSAISEGTFVSSPSGLSEVYECEKAFFDMTAKFATAFKQNRAMWRRQGAAMIGNGSASCMGINADRSGLGINAGRSGRAINATKSASFGRL